MDVGEQPPRGVMNRTYTAIIHLRPDAAPRKDGVLARILKVIRGVHQVTYEPTDALITVRFDDRLTNLAELVRTIEDAGSSVSGVAQRPFELSL